MTTEKQLPATRYDNLLASLHAHDLGGLNTLVMEGKQEGYRAALAALAPLHRQLVEALASVILRCQRCGGSGIIEHPTRKRIPISCAGCRDTRAALDAARKAGLS